MINFILQYWFIAALVVAAWAFNEVRKLTAYNKVQVDNLTKENMEDIAQRSEKARRTEVNKLLATLEKQLK